MPLQVVLVIVALLDHPITSRWNSSHRVLSLMAVGIGKPAQKDGWPSETLAFEIVSWRTWIAKGDRTAEDYIAHCCAVAAWAGGR